MQDDILTVTDAAEYLKLDDSTIRAMIHRRELAAIKVGRVYRIRRTDLENYLNQQTQPAIETNQ
jgi:excisionase family DNA binding protein